MTAVMCESFDWYGSVASPVTWLAGKWTEVSGWGNATGRNGRGLAGGGGILRRALSVAEQDDLLIIGFAIKWTSFISFIFLNLTSDINATVHTRLRLNVNGGLEVLRLGTIIASTPNNTLQLNVWHYIEIKVRLSDSTNDLYIKVDGVLQTLTPAGPYDTKNAGTMTVYDNVELDGSTSINPVFDDLYILNEQGTRNNDFLGDCRVEALFPNNAGAHTLWTPDSGANYARVNEQPPDDDVSYVQDSVDNDIDTYAFTDLVSVSGGVAFVQTTSRARKTDTGARSIANVQRLAGVEAQSADMALATTYNYSRNIFELEPDGVTGWTRADVNAAEFGPKARP